MLTILDGSTFVVSDDIGDVGSGAEGVFADDTRMLSRCRLLIDGESPLLLTSRAGRLLQRDPLPSERSHAPGFPQDTLSVSRERFVGETVTEHLVLSNEGMSELSFAVDLELAADFADIISVKAHDFAFGDPETPPALSRSSSAARRSGAAFRGGRGRRSGTGRRSGFLSRFDASSAGGARFQCRSRRMPDGS